MFPPPHAPLSGDPLIAPIFRGPGAIEFPIPYDALLTQMVAQSGTGFWLPLREAGGAIAKNYAYTQPIGTELFTNPGVVAGVGSPFAFTGDNPNSWAISGESGDDPEISEVGEGQGHASSPNVGGGYVNIYTGAAATAIGMSQDVQTIGDTYRTWLDVNRVVSQSIIRSAGGAGGANIGAVVNAPGLTENDHIATTVALGLKRGGANTDATIRGYSAKKIGEQDAAITAAGLRRCGLRGKSQAGQNILPVSDFAVAADYTINSGFGYLKSWNYNGWTPDANNYIEHTANGLHMVNAATASGRQMNTRLPVISGMPYEVTIDVAAVVSGQIRLVWGDGSQITSSDITAAGVYTYTAICNFNDFLAFQKVSSAAQDWTIRSITVKPVFANVHTNESFDSGSTGWTQIGGGATITFSGGNASWNMTGAASTGLYQTKLQVGQTYRGRVVVNSITGTVGFIRVSGQSGSSFVYKDILISDGPGTYEFDFVAAETAMMVWTGGGGGQNVVVSIASIEAFPYPGSDAYYFDGATTLLSVTNKAEIQGMTEFTVAMLLYPFTTGEGTSARFMSKSSEWDFAFNGASGAINCTVNYSGTNATAVTIAGNVVPMLRWSSVIIRYSESIDRMVRVYINGVEGGYSSGPIASVGTKVSNTNNIIVGNTVAVGSTQNGVIDEALLIKRALSAAEIANLHTMLTGAATGQSVAA